MSNFEINGFSGDMDRYLDIIHSQNKEWNTIPSHYYAEYNVKRGLRNADGTGVLAGLTSIGEVHGYILDEGDKTPIDGKLRYRGIDVEDIVAHCQAEKRFGFEETAFLILFGFLPSQDILTDFSKMLAAARPLPGEFTEDMILKAPSKNIMNKLGRSILALYSYDDNPDDISLPNLLQQSIQLIARFPVLIANSYACKRHYFDNESLVLHNPNPDLSAAENFLYMIRPDNKFTALEAEILDLTMTLQAEHGGGNNSAFAVHVLSSTGTDTYSAISGAVGSLKGPKHGGANDKMLSQMTEIKENVKNWEDENEVLEFLKKIIKKEAGDGKGLIYGMGHAVYTISDPRAVILKERAEYLAVQTGNEKEFKLHDLIERLAPVAFREIKGIDKAMCANVDFYSGFVYQMLGIPQELITPIFAMSRIVGWCAHRIEEVMTGTKIIRPAYRSTVKRIHYTPLSERETPQG
ncbi:MAG: citrate/2-methylcitrate synthase [Oscillospiraceae bacterium]